MIKIELTFTSVAEAAAFLAGRSGNEPVATATTVSQGASAASSTKPGASAGKTDKPVKEQKTEKPAKEEKADDATDAIDYDTQVKPVVNTVASMAEGSGGGRAVVLALLKEFGAAKGSEVKAEDLPAFKAKLEEIIANESVA